MRVGDLVLHRHTDRRRPAGIIVDFDVDGDPIVSFIESAFPGSGYAYFRNDIKVISESR